MIDLILHHYDASPFTQKAQRMLGLKKLAWHSVETPMIAPKPDLTVLTGGYRGTPVLQIGADVFVDTQCIAEALEERHPQPSLYPYGDRGLDLALVKWSDAFFRVGLQMIIALASDQWPDDFQRDRRALFSDVDFDSAHRDLDHARAQLRAHASLIETQLSDGRAFLLGDQPSLADIQAFAVPWAMRGSVPEVDGWFVAFKHLSAWEARVANLGSGTRHAMQPEEAHTVAAQSRTVCAPFKAAGEPLKLEPGDRVEVEPDDARRGGVRGTLLRLEPNRVVIRHHNETVGEVAVHFPRLGYRVSAL